MLMVLFSSFLASFGFGILFHIKKEKLVLAAIAGSIGSVVYTFMIESGMSSAASMFCASVCFSIFSEMCARICKAPVTTFIICALIPLVPGGGMYRTMLEAVQGDAMAAIEKGLQAISEAGALALGIILVSTLAKMITAYRRRKKGRGK